MKDDVVIFDDFNMEPRIQFLKDLSVLSVPVPGGEAFGAYMVESLATGVPIVQPNVGGYPEFIETTGGGIIYEPNEPKQLASAIESILSNPKQLREMGSRGRNIVLAKYTMTHMANSILDIYKKVKTNN